MANSRAYRFFPPNLMTEARPMTRPGQFDDDPWNKSMLAYLEHQLELDTHFTEHLKNKLKQMQESDADPEQIDIVHYKVQYMLAQLEKVTAEIELEKKKIAEAQKHTTKVSKKRPRQIAKPRKQTTEVPTQRWKE